MAPTGLMQLDQYPQNTKFYRINKNHNNRQHFVAPCIRCHALDPCKKAPVLPDHQSHKMSYHNIPQEHNMDLLVTIKISYIQISLLNCE